VTVTLRPYQIRALDLARAAYAGGKRRRVLLVAPTGAGKTVIFCAVAQGALAKGKRVLVLVHRRELVRQTIAKMHAAGIERIGVVAAGWSRDPEAPVQVGMVQTMIARDEYPDAHLLVADEAHHFPISGSAEWGQVPLHYASAKLLGVTATPERGDGAPLGDLFDTLIEVTTTRALIAAGHLCPVEVIAPTAARKAMAESPLEAYRALGGGRKAVFFCATVAEAEALALDLTAAGTPAACVHGDSDVRERDAALAKLACGDLRAVTNVYCLTEGWDCPSVEVCVLARGCGHSGTYLQMVGRVLRPSPETGKARALVIDLRGAVHQHGLPDEERVYSLEGTAIRSKREVKPRTCPGCDHVVAAAIRVCPGCGYRWPEPVEQEIEQAPLERITGKQRKISEREYWDSLVKTVRANGYKSGYAAHKFIEKYGRFPAKFWRETFARRVA
jgi:DNA repair protein RadD